MIVNRIIILLFMTMTFMPYANAYASIGKIDENNDGLIRIEDFFPRKNNWTVSTGINVANNNRKVLQSSGYVYNIYPGYVIVTQNVTDGTKERNSISGYGSAIYGVTNRFSATVSMSGQWTRDSYQGAVSDSKNRGAFNGLGIGGSYQHSFLSDHSVFYSSVNIRSGYVNGYIFGNSFSWIYDPAILNLSISYFDGITKEKFSTNYKMYSLAGKVSLALNPELSLNWGGVKDFVYIRDFHSNRQHINSKLSMIAGVSINISDGLSSFINVKGGVANNPDSVISFGLVYKI